MQTFLPYSDFFESAKVLDMKRLGKQRVECLQLLKACLEPGAGWSNHPACLMWKGYEKALLSYSNAICDEWISRGYKDTCKDKINNNSLIEGDLIMPIWIGNENFHASHRSNLLRKKPEYYSQFNWKEPDNLPYVWPSRK